MERRPHRRRAAALAVGLLIFALAGGACAARRAPSAQAATASPVEPAGKSETLEIAAPPEVPPTRTIETEDAKLAAAIAALKSGPSAGSLKAVAAEYMRLGVFDQ